MLYGEDIFDAAPGMTRRLNNPRSTRKSRLVDNRGMGKRTVEVMPINTRLTSEEKRDLFAVADSYSNFKEEPADQQNVPAVSEEELEALLKEFLAT